MQNISADKGMRMELEELRTTNQSDLAMERIQNWWGWISNLMIKNAKALAPMEHPQTTIQKLSSPTVDTERELRAILHNCETSTEQEVSDKIKSLSRKYKVTVPDLFQEDVCSLVGKTSIKKRLHEMIQAVRVHRSRGVEQLAKSWRKKRAKLFCNGQLTGRSKAWNNLLNNREKVSMVVPHVIDTNGTVESGAESVKQAAADTFYNWTASTDTCPPEPTIKEMFLPIDHDDCQRTANSLLVNITISDVDLALEAARPGKATGPSQISRCMIAAAPVWVRDTLVVVYNLCLLRRVPDTWRHGIICPIPKPGEPPLWSSMRPITLMDHHVKVLTRILSKRLKPIMALTMNGAQTGFTPGHSTLDHLLTIAALINDAVLEKKELHVVTIDCAKAFDSVELWALRHAYQAAGLTKEEVEMLAAFDGGSAAVSTPVGLSPSFKIEKGVRQGEVLSPQKFNMWLNVLLLRLAAMNVGGYKITGTTEAVRVLAYADDICLVASNQEELNAMFAIVVPFLRSCGVRVNSSKTHYMTNNRSQVCQLNWPLDTPNCPAPIAAHDETHAFKYLGVWFTLNGIWDKQESAWTASINEFCELVTSKHCSSAEAKTQYEYLTMRLQYGMQVAFPSEKWIHEQEKKLRRIILAAANMRGTSAATLPYAPINLGGLGLLRLHEVFVIARLRSLKLVNTRLSVGVWSWQTVRDWFEVTKRIIAPLGLRLHRTGDPIAIFHDSWFGRNNEGRVAPIDNKNLAWLQRAWTTGQLAPGVSSTNARKYTMTKTGTGLPPLCSPLFDEFQETTEDGHIGEITLRATDGSKSDKGYASYAIADMLTTGSWRTSANALPITTTINEAEGIAILEALSRSSARQLHIITDSMVVSLAVQRIMNKEATYHLAHPNLWSNAAKLIQKRCENGGTVTLSKVRSHIPSRLWTKSSSPELFAGNDAADKAAVVCRHNVALTPREGKITVPKTNDWLTHGLQPLSVWEACGPLHSATIARYVRKAHDTLMARNLASKTKQGMVTRLLLPLTATSVRVGAGISSVKAKGLYSTTSQRNFDRFARKLTSGTLPSLTQLCHVDPEHCAALATDQEAVTVSCPFDKPQNKTRPDDMHCMWHCNATLEARQAAGLWLKDSINHLSQPLAPPNKYAVDHKNSTDVTVDLTIHTTSSTSESKSTITNIRKQPPAVVNVRLECGDQLPQQWMSDESGNVEVHAIVAPGGNMQPSASTHVRRKHSVSATCISAKPVAVVVNVALLNTPVDYRSLNKEITALAEQLANRACVLICPTRSAKNEEEIGTRFGAILFGQYFRNNWSGTFGNRKEGLWRRVAQTRISVYIKQGDASLTELAQIKEFCTTAMASHALLAKKGIMIQSKQAEEDPSIQKPSGEVDGPSMLAKVLKHTVLGGNRDSLGVELLMRGVMPPVLIEHWSTRMPRQEALDRAEILLWGWRQQLLLIWSKFAATLAEWQSVATPLWSAAHKHRHASRIQQREGNYVHALCVVKGCQNKRATNAKVCTVCRARKLLEGKFAESVVRQQQASNSWQSDPELREKLDKALANVLKWPLLTWPRFNQWCARKHQHRWDKDMRGIAWSRYKVLLGAPSAREKKRQTSRKQPRDGKTGREGCVQGSTRIESSPIRTVLGKVLAERIADKIVEKFKQSTLLGWLKPPSEKREKVDRN